MCEEVKRITDCGTNISSYMRSSKIKPKVDQGDDLKIFDEVDNNDFPSPITNITSNSTSKGSPSDLEKYAEA
jgi:hypothetical protein